MRVLAAVIFMCAGAAARADDTELVRQNYQLHCLGCHGDDGAGLEGQVPSFRGTLARIAGTSPGRDYVLRVPGVTQSTLSAREVAEVLNWLLAEFSGAAAAGGIRPFTAAEVASARNRTLLEVTPARARLLGDAQ
jgi:mono/diheme cytochrome c family protein